MNAGTPGAPERAGKARHAAARYGIRWRARDAARQLGYWARHAHVTTLIGTGWKGGGLIFLALSVSGGHVLFPVLAFGTVLLAAGQALCTVAREKGWRR